MGASEASSLLAEINEAAVRLMEQAPPRPAEPVLARPVVLTAPLASGTAGAIVITAASATGAVSTASSVTSVKSLGEHVTATGDGVSTTSTANSPSLSAPSTPGVSPMALPPRAPTFPERVPSNLSSLPTVPEASEVSAEPRSQVEPSSASSPARSGGAVKRPASMSDLEDKALSERSSVTSRSNSQSQFQAPPIHALLQPLMHAPQYASLQPPLSTQAITAPPSAQQQQLTVFLRDPRADLEAAMGMWIVVI